MKYVIKKYEKFLAITDRSTGKHRFGPLHKASPFFHYQTATHAAQAVRGKVVSIADALGTKTTDTAQPKTVMLERDHM